MIKPEKIGKNLLKVSKQLKKIEEQLYKIQKEEYGLNKNDIREFFMDVAFIDEHIKTIRTLLDEIDKKRDITTRDII